MSFGEKVLDVVVCFLVLSGPELLCCCGAMGVVLLPPFFHFLPVVPAVNVRISIAESMLAPTKASGGVWST